MRFALVNPRWSFEGSIYFGCREPHLPIEFGYSKALIEAAGHEAMIIDAQFDDLDLLAVRERLREFSPDFTVLTTAPSYLFWRCAPPELRVPMDTAAAVRDVAGRIVIVGPHASTTPGATLRKLQADAVVLGECETVLPELAGDWSRCHSLCLWKDSRPHVQGGLNSTDLAKLPALDWPRDVIVRHHHHHHRFDAPPEGPGVEIEASRGCPYTCTFCAKENFRNKYRRRPVATVIEELDRALAAGAQYVYFIDEIFLPNRELLEAVRDRPVKFGVQTRIDLWSHDMIELLGAAGCVSVEAGVESISPEGREWLDKRCRLDTQELADRLVYAKRFIPFVQANLIEIAQDNPAVVNDWREYLIERGVWANEPVPLFPYPGSPDYTRLFGPPDDLAWERAHQYYLEGHTAFSDIQESRPLPLVQLEASQ